MMTDTPAGPGRIPRYLALAWFALVGLAALAGVLFVFVPNEALAVFGRERSVAYALAFVLVVAIVGLPLLVAAALLGRRSGRGGS